MASSIFLNPSFGLSSSGGSVTFTTPALFADGLGSAPGLAFASEPGTGFFKQAAGSLGVALSGGEWARFSAGNFLVFGNTATVALGNSSDALLSRVAAGQINMTDASSHGIGFDVVTDAVMKVRTRAQTGYATVDALGYKVSGVAGVAAFGPSAVASITVVNGIITAIS